MDNEDDVSVPVLRYGLEPNSVSPSVALSPLGTNSKTRPIRLVLIWLASIWLAFPLLQFVLGFFLPGAWYDVYLFCYALFAGPTYGAGWWLAFRYRLNAWSLGVPLAVSAVPTVIGFLWTLVTEWISWGSPWSYFGGFQYYFLGIAFRVISFGAFAVPLWLYSRGTVTYLGSETEDEAPPQLGVIHLMGASLVFAILLMTSRVAFSNVAGQTGLGDAGAWQVTAFVSGLFFSLTWILATWVYVAPKPWKIVVALLVSVGGNVGSSMWFRAMYSESTPAIPRIFPEWLSEAINATIIFGSILLTFYVIEKHGYKLRVSRKSQTPQAEPDSVSGQVKPGSDAIFAD
ncbi:MAG: hypothetical protein AAGG44_14890 [Planctomycetota bacterium]